jgi:hypothetical protein
MTPKVGTRVTVAVEGDAVELRPAGEQGGFRVSPRGQMELRAEALSVLAAGTARHYWLELDDQHQTVTLHPYA